MPISLATHLKLSRCGIYYFRMRVPAALRQAIGKREIIHSLKTRDSAKARRLAYTFASKTYELFEMAYDPTKFNPADLSTFPTADRVKTYEIDLSRGILKSTDAEDHKLMMEALAVMKSMPVQPAAPIAPIAPAQWVEPPPSHTSTISKALPAYLATLPNTKTSAAYERMILRFIEHCGDIELHKIRDVDVVTWNAKLLVGDPKKGYKPQAPTTADNSIGFLQSLLIWAKNKAYIHPSAVLATDKKKNFTRKQKRETTQGAEAFSVEQLIQIFDSIAYKDFCENSPARYWLPLIALHTGMRLEEIAKLRDVDVLTEDGIDFFSVNRLEREIKTDSGIRKVPFHDTLIKLGFMDYVRSRKGKKWLFDESGSAVSHAFIRYIEKIGVKKEGDKKRMVFHSFRDTFNNKLLRAKIPREMRLELMGHAQDDTNAENYSSPYSITELKVDGIDMLVLKETVAGVTHTLVL